MLGWPLEGPTSLHALIRTHKQIISNIVTTVISAYYVKGKYVVGIMPKTSSVLYISTYTYGLVCSTKD